MQPLPETPRTPESTPVSSPGDITPVHVRTSRRLQGLQPEHGLLPTPSRTMNVDPQSSAAAVAAAHQRPGSVVWPELPRNGISRSVITRTIGREVPAGRRLGTDISDQTHTAPEQRQGKRTTSSEICQVIELSHLRS
ncbi:hypothetical protein HPB50_024938 [Hyalomma asiaticum]|uniref:Uncharacterized protein n=1 Tax=Hyalomma asiaticum TaxID=266040 RepID=A0ACB7TQU4_HYAAI|nr:hypothetical protein HPB50_024938 [Hyalomma asiaticum]